MQGIGLLLLTSMDFRSRLFRFVIKATLGAEIGEAGFGHRVWRPL